ncbi:MAG: transcription-repair coupling factor [Desulforegulaceae bacterium]|nr:transcription-repair coupling factor [Desulforegulaceae bacterium]
MDFTQELKSAEFKSFEISGINSGSSGYIISRIKRSLLKPVFVFAKDEEECERLALDTSFFLSEDDIRIFPGYTQDIFKSDSFHMETASKRIKLLFEIYQGFFNKVVFIPFAEALRFIIPQKRLEESVDIYGVFEDIKMDDIISKLSKSGYSRASIVEEPGDFAVRGGILDFYPPLYDDPVRIEFFGDQIESIRIFSVVTQRKIKDIKEVFVAPVSEIVFSESENDAIFSKIRKKGANSKVSVDCVKSVLEKIKNEGCFQGIESILPLFYETKTNFTDYLPEDCVVVFSNFSAFEESFQEVFKKNEENYYNAIESGTFILHPKDLFESEMIVKEKLFKFKNISLKNLPGSENKAKSIFLKIDDNSVVKSRLKLKTGSDFPLSPLSEWIFEKKGKNIHPLIVCSSKTQCERLSSVLKPYGVDAEIYAKDFSFENFSKKTHIFDPFIAAGELAEGFTFEDEGIAIITENEIFGVRHSRRKKVRKLAGERIYSLNELNIEDIVVHAEHGLGKYKGLEKINIGNIQGEFAIVEYFDNDRLYVPVDRINILQKYVGAEHSKVNLDRLGGKDFTKAKEKARKKAEKIAKELLSVYAKREIESGYAYSPPDDLFKDFEAGFPYVETSGQLKAIKDVLKDMTSKKPMDRLICGDVGYGKTEVAVRAAFKAWSESKQTAVLVPTTILAEQHFKTFSDRFEGYPVKICVLNRFKTKKEQLEIIKQMKSGEADIVIGTHRLLQNDIEFNSLGLLVIDEEQRFGVKHKEKIKGIRASVDVLTLTATPIPRTLHLSLSGIRDISIISTPPEARQPVNTYISGFDESVVKEAVLNEIKRNGQVYFVHNSIETIDGICSFLEKILPNIKIGKAHGRMPEKQLEESMKKFIHKQTDVLVCTTIVESGLDIPDANTMIINRADRFGLSQLYQLRGRIGRGRNQAHAYLFIPEENRLTKEASKRLKVLMQYSELGAGFQLAMGDLQIRGAGDILGASQSGHVSAIGYDMFLTLLQNEVSHLKGEEIKEVLEPEINIGLSAYIPEVYIPDIDQRMIIYRRLSKLTELKKLREFKLELSDRYGNPPREVENLLLKIMLRIICVKTGIIQLDMNKSGLTFIFSKNYVTNPLALKEFVQKNKGWKIDSNLKLFVDTSGIKPSFLNVKNILISINEHVKNFGK